MADSSSEIEAERLLAQALFPRTKLRNVWTPPVQDDDVVRRPDATHEIGYISDIDFSPNGKTVVATSTSGSICILDPNTGRQNHYIKQAHEAPVSRLRYVSDYQFVTGSADCCLALWDVRNMKDGALNVWRGHCKPIRSIDYDNTTNYVISSAQDGEIRYWHLPNLQKADSAQQGGENASQGVLFTCPKFNQACSNDRFLVFANAHGCMFIVENLSVQHLKKDLENFRFDESIRMQLCFFAPNASMTKRNRIQIVEANDYSPISWSTISNISHISLHPTLPILLMRITTTRRTEMRPEIKEWTCVCNLQHQKDFGGIFGSFGSDVMEEVLLYASEETRYSSFVEKRPSFSRCGRLISSPTKDGMQLLAYSENLDSYDASLRCSLTQQWRSNHTSFWSSCSTTPCLTPVAKIESQHPSVCYKFSPNDYIIAVGDSNSQVYFCQPQM